MNFDRPWMTALEMQFAAMKYADGRVGTGANPNGPNGGKIVKTAEAYFWNSETAKAVQLASRTVPANTQLQRSILPGTGAGWWWFGDALDMSPYNSHEPNLCAIAWGAVEASTRPAGVLFLLFCLSEENRPYCSLGFVWPWDTDLSYVYESVQSGPARPDDLMSRAIIHESARFFAAGCAWLQQRIIAVGLGHVERHRRKQLARETNLPVSSDVHVVQLRRFESTKPGHSPDTPELVDWSCRWIVNGHWRNQPYKDERKLIYIMPYVKGPDDKPLKVPAHTVYAVTR